MKALLLILPLLVLSVQARAEFDEAPREENPSSSYTAPESNVSVSSKPETPEPPKKSRLPPRGESRYYSWWSPETYHLSIGFEKGASSTAILTQDNIVFGTWLTREFGIDFFVGYAKDADTSQVATTTQETGTSTLTRTTSSTFTGTSGSHKFTGGMAWKVRGFQNSWFQFYGGLLFAYTTPQKTEGTTGTRAEVIPDIANPTTKTVTESAYGNTVTETKAMYSAGPKLGTEFYIKWFPHLALGFSTGILATLGGETTKTDSITTRTVTITNGSESAPGPTDAPTTTVTTSKPGFRAGTFGIGGTALQINAAFTLRYVW